MWYDQRYPVRAAKSTLGACACFTLLLLAPAALSPHRALHAVDGAPAPLRPDQAEPAGVISYLRGDCLIRDHQHQPYHRAAAGREVHTSTWLKTGPDSAAELVMADGAVIRLTPDSEITLHDYPLGATRSTGIGLLFGRVDVVARRLQGALQVHSVTVTAGVRGTSFSVAIREDGEALILVGEGSVSASFENRQVLISAGGRVVFTLDGETSEPGGELTYDRWRRQAVERIRTDPRAVSRRMLARERVIVQRLKRQQDTIERYHEQWRRFLRRADLLHRQQRYDEEQALIEGGMESTGKAVLFFSGVRGDLAAVRSVMVLAARIERHLDRQALREVPELGQMTAEYRRISAVIERADAAERTLQRVLYLLNRRDESPRENR